MNLHSLIDSTTSTQTHKLINNLQVNLEVIPLIPRHPPPHILLREIFNRLVPPSQHSPAKRGIGDHGDIQFFRYLDDSYGFLFEGEDGELNLDRCDWMDSVGST
jgi:hypothetical protein